MINTIKQAFLGTKELYIVIKRSLRYTFSFAPKSSLGFFATSVVIAIVPFLQSKAFGSLVDALINTVKNNGQGVWLFLFIYAGLNAVDPLIKIINSYFNKIWYFYIQTEFEVLIPKKRAEIDIAHHESAAFQDLLQRSIGNRGYWPIVNLAEMQFESIANVISILLGSVLALTFSWKVYVLILVTAIPKFIIELKYGKSVWTIWSEDSENKRKMANLKDYFRGRVSIVEVKLFQSATKFLSIIKAILDEFNTTQINQEKRKLLVSSMAEILSMVGFVTASVLIVRDVTSGLVAVGTMTFMLSTLKQLDSSISSFLINYARQYEHSLYAKDVFAILDTKPFLTYAENPVPLNINTAPTITFENVSFKYEGSTSYVLKHINLNFIPGEKVGLVGNNGAGKTTLIKLLCRIYDPTEGRILINGVDLKDADIQEWWKATAVLFQDFATYDFKAKDSIAVSRADEETSDERVIDAAEQSASDEFILKWKDKYDQQLGVEFGGIEPSKGQRQKLALARVLYRHAPVLILDEPTAAVDAESEARIFANLEAMSKDTTAILISHDFSTIRRADRIVVMKDGEVKEDGTHKSLMKAKGLYSELFTMQLQGYTK